VLWIIAAALSLAWSAASLSPPAAAAAGPQAPTVACYTVENADLAVSSEYIGRVEPIQSVLLRPQITGEIAKVSFKEGSLVKQGDLLFTLDDRHYAAIVDVKKADLARAEAARRRASRYSDRLKAADKRSVSASDLDTAENDVLQGKAGVAQAQAALKLAQLDLEHTKIQAPITGKIGKAAFTKGNYVSPSGQPLAGIVQTDPIRVAFALPDRSYLANFEAFASVDEPVFYANLRLSDGTEYPFEGERDFEENTVGEKTSTVMVRLRFRNERGLLVPGAMVRVTIKPVKSRISPVIPQESVMADRQGDFVYVVDSENVARQRRITSGAEIGTMLEVTSGLQAGENIIVRGLQSVRPGAPVNPVPLRREGGAKSPAERAAESGHDLGRPEPAAPVPADR
jgi:RND family efflux transporter MFP subunit